MAFKILLGYKEKKASPEFLGAFHSRVELQDAVNKAPKDFQFFEAGQLLGYPLKRRGEIDTANHGKVRVEKQKQAPKPAQPDEKAKEEKS